MGLEDENQVVHYQHFIDFGSSACNIEGAPTAAPLAEVPVAEGRLPKRRLLRCQLHCQHKRRQWSSL
jgi:hypothetical protein